MKPLPQTTLHGYGAGIVAYMLAINGLEMILSPIIIIELGFNPLWWGLLKGGMSLWDAVTDPWMGHVSDQTRTRFGRRRPFILAGAILTGLALPLVLLIPGESLHESTYYGLLTAGALLYYLCFTVYAVPYLSLGYELTASSHQRVQLQFFRAIYAVVPGIAGGWFYRAAQWEGFGDVFSGARWLALGAGLIIVVAGSMPFVCCREPYYRLLGSDRHSQTLIAAFGQVFTNRPFLLLMGSVLIMLSCVAAATSIGAYANIYYLFAGDTKAGASLSGQIATVTAVASLASVFAVRWLAVRLGKLTTLRLTLGVNLAGTASQWFLYTPEAPHLALISCAMIAPGAGAFWIVANAMKADICDWDELHYGRRREGVFAAAANWVQKGAIGLASALSGAGLMAIGFDADLGGDQAPGTLLAMRLFLSWIPAMLILACILLLGFYPLTEAKMAEVQAELESRRGKVD